MRKVLIVIALLIASVSYASEDSKLYEMCVDVRVFDDWRTIDNLYRLLAQDGKQNVVGFYHKDQNTIYTTLDERVIGHEILHKLELIGDDE